MTARDLVRNALRMRPDRIILGEVRGGEALDMLQAMNTGHEGSLTTIHANDARDALSRLEVMVAMAGFDLPVDVVRRYIASAINVIVHLARLKGGVRRVMRIAEIVDLENNEYQLRELFRFQQAGLDAQGLATGRFHVSGNVPAFLDRLRERGIALDAEVVPGPRAWRIDQKAEIWNPKQIRKSRNLKSRNLKLKAVINYRHSKSEIPMAK